MVKKDTSLIIIVLAFLLLVTITVLASDAYPVYVKPIPRALNTSFNYTFNFSVTPACSVALVTVSKLITTDSDGIGFTSLNLTNLTSPPSYVCEYKNGVLRKSHEIGIGLFNKAFVQRIIATNLNITSDAAISGVLTVNNNTIINGNVTAKNLTVTGNVNIAGNIDVASLNVSGNITAYGTKHQIGGLWVCENASAVFLTANKALLPWC